MAIDKLNLPSLPLVNMVRLQKDVGGSHLSYSMMRDIARGFATHIPITKLVHLDADIHFYLTTLMIAALKHYNETLIVPKSLKSDVIPDMEWENMIMWDPSKNYD